MKLVEIPCMQFARIQYNIYYVLGISLYTDALVMIVILQ